MYITVKRTLALLLILMLGLGTLAGCQREEPDLTPSDPSTADDQNQGDTTTPSEPDTSSDTPLPEGEGTLRVAVSADIFDIRKIRFHFSRNQTIQKGTQTWEMEVPQAFAEMTISPENRFQDFNLRIADLTVKKLLTIRQINFAAQRMAPKQVNANGPFIETHLDVHDLTIADYTGWPMNKEVEYFYLNGNVIGTIERQPIFSESLYDWIEKDGHIEVKKMILNWQPLVMVAKGDLYFNENLAPNLTLNTSSLALVDTLDKMNANGWLEDKGVFVARILLNNKSFKKNQSDKYFTVTTPLKINNKQILIENIPVKTLDGSVRGQEKVPSSADSGTPENQTN